MAFESSHYSNWLEEATSVARFAKIHYAHDENKKGEVANRRFSSVKLEVLKGVFELRQDLRNSAYELIDIHGDGDIVAAAVRRDRKFYGNVFEVSDAAFEFKEDRDYWKGISVQDSFDEKFSSPDSFELFQYSMTWLYLLHTHKGSVSDVESELWGTREFLALHSEIQARCRMQEGGV